MLDPISDEVLGSRAMFIDQLLDSDEPVGQYYFDRHWLLNVIWSHFILPTTDGSD